MSVVLLNLFLGIVPALALAWSIAADERRTSADKVVDSERDRLQHNIIFSLIYGLWGLTMAMWNWMRTEPEGWIIFWLVLGITGLILCRWLVLRRNRRAG